MMRFPRRGSLRVRLTIAFLLVSIPSMLAAALIAAQLLSNAFDTNLQQWLEEASHYFQGDIEANGAENARVAELVGPRARSMWVSTFHSACVRILRREADRLGMSSSFTIYDSQDSQRLMAPP